MNCNKNLVNYGSKILKTAIISLLITITSCLPAILKNILGDKIELKKLTNGTKDVVFFPMTHIGKVSFYTDVANKVDSMENLGYVFLYESVHTQISDSTENDRIDRKTRKIFGIQPSVLTNRIDTTNKMLFEQLKYEGDLDLMEQPPYSQINLDTSQAMKADTPIEELIAAFEKKYGEVELTDCDWITSFDGEYNCNPLPKKMRRAFKDEYIHDYRNTILADKVLETQSNKIAIIYGMAHYKSLKKILKSQNPKWTEVD